MDEPFVYRNDRPVVLLDLLLPQSQIGDEGHVRSSFQSLLEPFPGWFDRIQGLFFLDQASLFSLDLFKNKLGLQK